MPWGFLDGSIGQAPRSREVSVLRLQTQDQVTPAAISKSTTTITTTIHIGNPPVGPGGIGGKAHSESFHDFPSGHRADVSFNWMVTFSGTWQCLAVVQPCFTKTLGKAAADTFNFELFSFWSNISKDLSSSELTAVISTSTKVKDRDVPSRSFRMVAIDLELEMDKFKTSKDALIDPFDWMASWITSFNAGTKALDNQSSLLRERLKARSSYFTTASRWEPWHFSIFQVKAFGACCALGLGCFTTMAKSLRGWHWEARPWGLLRLGWLSTFFLFPRTVIWTLTDQRLHFGAIATSIITMTPIAKMILTPRTCITTALGGIARFAAFFTRTKDIFKGTPNSTKASSISTGCIATSPFLCFPHPFALSNINTTSRTGCVCTAFSATFSVTSGVSVLHCSWFLSERHIHLSLKYLAEHMFRNLAKLSVHVYIWLYTYIYIYVHICEKEKERETSLPFPWDSIIFSHHQQLLGLTSFCCCSSLYCGKCLFKKRSTRHATCDGGLTALTVPGMWHGSQTPESSRWTIGNSWIWCWIVTLRILITWWVTGVVHGIHASSKGFFKQWCFHCVAGGIATTSPKGNANFSTSSTRFILTGGDAAWEIIFFAIFHTQMGESQVWIAAMKSEICPIAAFVAATIFLSDSNNFIQCHLGVVFNVVTTTWSTVRYFTCQESMCANTSCNLLSLLCGHQAGLIFGTIGTIFLSILHVGTRATQTKPIICLFHWKSHITMRWMIRKDSYQIPTSLIHFHIFWNCSSILKTNKLGELCLYIHITGSHVVMYTDLIFHDGVNAISSAGTIRCLSCLLDNLGSQIIHQTRCIIQIQIAGVTEILRTFASCIHFKDHIFGSLCTLTILGNLQSKGLEKPNGEGQR